jgi:steroid delta-isomerase-like uncharacterized protein
MEARNKEILRNFIREVWTEGKVDAADEYLAPRYTVHHDPGDPWDGEALDLADFKERVRKSRAPFPDQRFVIRELIAEPNRVVATWHWTGTHAGDIPGFPASGKPISTSGITVYYFDGEMISGHWQVTDRSGVQQQLSQ